MLHRMDRVVVAAEDPAVVAGSWVRLLGAEPEGQDAVPGLKAISHRWRVGDGWLEVLQPDTSGTGPVADALVDRGPHLFAAGFTATDLDVVGRHLARAQVRGVPDGERYWLDPVDTRVAGLRLVIGVERELPAVGLLDRFYEASLLVADAPAAVHQATSVLALDPAGYVPIDSDRFGYEGTLTLVDPDRLDRLEIITPTREGTTMERWFRRTGGGYYMAFAECGRLAEVEARAAEAGVGATGEPAADRRDERGPHTVFLHPDALGGMMLGLSRPGWAWTWSGHPERAEGA